jgi:membrane protein required for colicin V production
MALVVVAILVTGFTPLPADSWWKESKLIQSFMPLVTWSTEFLPTTATDNLDFDPQTGEKDEERDEDRGEKKGAAPAEPENADSEEAVDLAACRPSGAGPSRRA